MLDVVFFEVFAEEEKALKKYLPATLKAEFTPHTIQEAKSKNLPAPLISVRTQSVIPTAWSKRLKGVLTRSSGYEHLLDFRRENKSDAACGYLADYCSRAVAEQAVLMAAALLRKLKLQTKQFDRFNRDNLTGFEIQGRKCLVVGVGYIGRQVVDIAKGLKMYVKGVDLKHAQKDLKYVGLLEGIRWADVVICALPLTKETRGMLNYDVLKQIPRGSILVNVSRGEITPLADMERLLEEKILGGLGLDVYENEGRLAVALRANKKVASPQAQSLVRLSKKEQVLFTPHNAFNTYESVERKAQESAESIMAFIKTGKFLNPVPQE
ncbi:MAG: hypothetical protein A2787_01685 [Omnitrophica WOR_2 bacterium RIFCSPHIGHO2_01_FULL_48_9]|nr:MAG: hypothetical protein A2787_01685 [Omnitrophica WOR_2 bacterium RIFCSPHIGHO2_01_FULL_48_9]